MFTHVNFVIRTYSKNLVANLRYISMSSVNQVKRMQPSWTAPEGNVDKGLKLYNSLTRKKESFITSKEKKVNWYTCGPTVYDDSHMGHARSYICFDIMRRILRDYFKYDVFYVMNITDIDDKIIKRARQQFLFQEYLKKEKSVDEINQDAVSSIEMLKTKMSKEQNEDKKNTIARDLEKTKNALKEKDNVPKEVLLEQLRDALSIWLDQEQGSSVTDNEIFLELPRRFENRFHEDMKALNVLYPDVLTRVSEYIPEIIEFTEKIISNGYGYASNGSVYFDTTKFDESPNHSYAKLVPEAFGDTCALEEGEGELGASVTERSKDKKNKTDFALWKISKEGEPSWDSPWGKGRPGWHIECSAMAGKVLGESVDIHTGGVDLKFPHHDNELAQSEAYYGNDNWVKYFLHSGHLTISGCKMSKSLKNFISIKDALQNHSAMQLRLLFLLHGWNDTLDYGSSTMEIAVSYDKMLNNFLSKVKYLSWKQKNDEASRQWTEEESDLDEKFKNHEKKVREHLCDNLETRAALECISSLIRDTNKYVDLKKSANQLPDKNLLKDIAAYITDIFKMFGAIETREQSNVEDQILEYVKVFSKFRDDIRALKKEDSDISKICDELKDNVLPSLGFELEDEEDGDAKVTFVDKKLLLKGREDGLEIDEQKLDYVGVLSKFRDDIKAEARKKKDGDILKLCDQLRDDKLTAVGIKLEDEEGQDAVVLFADREVLKKEKEARLEQIKLKKQEQLAKEKAKLEAGKIDPSEMFKSETSLYSVFDERGVPTHDASGEPLPKSKLKNLEKQYQTQSKKHEQYLKFIKSNKDNGL